MEVLCDLEGILGAWCSVREEDLPAVDLWRELKKVNAIRSFRLFLSFLNFFVEKLSWIPSTDEHELLEGVDRASSCVSHSVLAPSGRWL